MNAEKIRKMPAFSNDDEKSCELHQVQFLREIAAQLAEMNEKLTVMFNPPLMVNMDKVDMSTFDTFPQGPLTIRERRPTLRDQFAMAALTGLLADPASSGPEGCARVAYAYADAILKERVCQSTQE